MVSDDQTASKSQEVEESPTLDDFETTYKRARKKLNSKAVQDELARLMAAYWSDIQPIIICATAENGGVRQAQLENEIYSCFHHVARGLCHKQTSADTIKDISIGVDSHLKRTQYDAYKTAIKPQLTRLDLLIDDMRHITLDPDFNPNVFGAAPIQRIAHILEQSHEVKKNYEAAKLYEASGDHANAIESYTATLNGCFLLSVAMNEIMKENVYIIAKAHIQRREEEKQQAERTRLHEREEDRADNRKNCLISQIIAAAAVIVATISLIHSCSQQQEHHAPPPELHTPATLH